MNLLDLFVKIGVDDQASGEIDAVSQNVVGKLGSAAATAAKALAGAFAVQKVVEFGKAAFDSYAEFEQLSGGIEKLYGNAGMSIEQYAQSVGKAVDEVTADYERNAEAEKLLFENAQQAWKTAGMTANEYMSTATQFSASLITSLGGDTEEAARITDRAMTAISDNVNTFGSDAESVQNAILGISKGNYTMLDNLKLGFAGTKEGAEELVKAANEWGAANGEASDLSVDSFADMIVAIEQVQKAQGIYGTTSREALSTIEGSIGATKAAWSNLVAEFGKPDADIGARIGDMFTAILGENGEGGLLRNVTEEVGVIADNVISAIGEGIATGFDWLLTNGPTIVQDAIRGLADAMDSALTSLVDMESFDIAGALFGGEGEDSGMVDKVVGFVQGIVAAISENWPYVMTQLQALWDEIVILAELWGPQILAKLGEIGQSLLGWIGQTVQSIIQFVIENGPQILTTIYETLWSILEWLSGMLPQIVTTVGETLASIVNYIVEHREEILAAVVEAFRGIIAAIAEHGPTVLNNVMTAVGELAGYLVGAAAELLSGLLQSLQDHWPEISQWFMDLPQNILNALGDLGGVLVDAGMSLISGLWDGMTAKFEEAGKWVSGIGGWIAEHKGPKQYDLGLLVPNGKWIMQGLDKGLKKGLPDVQKTLSGITDTISTGVSADVSVRTATPTNDPVLAMLAEIRDNIGSDIYLDGKTLVGGTAPLMNRAIARL